MSGLFSKPDAPSVPTPPPAPTISDADAAGQAKADQLRRRRGMASTVLSGSSGNAQPTTQAAAALLGS